MRAWVLAAALLVPLAGCFGATEEPAPEPASATDDNATRTKEENATLPDGRGQSSGVLEANRTEQGAGGVEHRHDYWQGRETVVLFEGDVALGFFPMLPEGEGSTPKSVGYARLPNGSLVYEGAARVDVLVANPRLEGTAHPAPPALSLQVRTAADADWREKQPVAYGEAIEIRVAPHETDMPHSTSSLWAFRLVAERDEPMTLAVTVTAHRGRDVADWPGHPDFYADRRERVVFDGDVTTRIHAVPESFLYEGNEWAVPTLLISHGTKRLEVWANVTGLKTTTPGLGEVNGYVLNFHDATQIGYEPIYNWIGDVDSNDLESYNFTVPVFEEGMDGPYQPLSRWGFRVEATWGSPSFLPAGFGCGGCSSSYEVSYHLTVIAYADEAAPAKE